MSYPRYISPAAGSTQQIAVSPAITPAKPGLYCGFVSVPMLFADSSNDTRADKLSVVQTRPFLRSRIVIQQFVKLLPSLHLTNPFLLRAALFESLKEFLAGFHRHAECALWKNHHPITESHEILERNQRTFAKLGHIRQQRHIDLTGKITKLLFALQRFRKYCIRTRFDIALRPINSSIEIFYRTRIRPCDDHEIGIATRPCGRFDSSRHFIDIHQGFASNMSAAFWKFLVFNVATGQPRGFEFIDRASDVLRTPKAGIRINDRGNLHRLGDVSCQSHHLDRKSTRL